MAISGNLRTMPFADLMQWISMSRKTGTLVIKGPTFTKKILFSDGTVSAVTSNNPREHLGYYLVGWGYISEAELQDLLERQRELRMMLGELLVKVGKMGREEVNQLVRTKSEQLIYDLMLWQEGEFFFLDETHSRREFQELNLTVDHFIFEGARQADERRRIEEVIPSTAAIPRLVKALDEESLDPLGRAIVGRIDGARSIEQIALSCRTPAFNVLRFVYQALHAGTVEVRGPEAEAAPIPGSGPTTWRDLLREAENSISLGDLLEAYRHLRTVRERYPRIRNAQDGANALELEIEKELGKMSLDSAIILELAVPFQEITRLQCGPDEAFILSRINGLYTLPQVLQQLPGPVIYNRLIIHSFVQRGVIKLRESQAVTKFKGVW